MRFLLESGKPLPQMTLLVLDTGSNGRPFGAICQTVNRRLIFWPPLPRDIAILSTDGKRGVYDHITLELANRQSHATSFDAFGNRDHHSPGWKLHDCDGSGLAYWFSILLRWSLLDEQDHAVDVLVRSPA